jgi:ADP-ribose pyrophosphatase YjhB (NUDIX family)
VELSAPPPVACARCGAEHWRNPKPGAGTIVVQEDSVLLVKRAHAPWKGAWAAPSGFCDPGEHPIETARREALEETGYEIEVTGYLGVWVHRHADDPIPEEAEVVNVSYYHAVPVGDPVASFDLGEVSELAWCAWDELPDELAPPSTLRSILEAARGAHRDGGTVHVLRDRSAI